MDTMRPTYLALIRAAVEATGAARGWLLRVEDDHLAVVAAHGDPAASGRVGLLRPVAGTAGYVAASGQPAAIQTRPGDVDNVGAGGADALPSSILAAPCESGELVGVLEVVDAVNGSFTYDDVETLTLLAEIAGAALAEGDELAAPPSPARLGEALSSLSTTDPGRYREVARAVEALL